MPRVAREISKSGIYHIMLRGANRQEIFHDDEDFMKFLCVLDKYKKRCDFKLFCWCLMGNHIHLLLREGNEKLALTMKRIGVSFARYYNIKYNTIGHLFQDRFKSEKVEDDGYLLTVARYIHMNPIKAGLVVKPEDWKWSSHHAYKFTSFIIPSLLDDDFIPSICSLSGYASGLDYVLNTECEISGSDEVILEDLGRRSLTDSEARDEIAKLLNNFDIMSIKVLPKSQRNETIATIKRIRGLSQRQISRLLGVPLSLVYRA